MISTEPLPNGFSTGIHYTSPLRIYAWEGRFVLYDGKGYLCVCEEEDLLRLLKAEAARPPDPLRPRYWPRARDLVDPGYAEREEAKVLAVEAVIPRSAAPVKKNLSLEDLGL